MCSVGSAKASEMVIEINAATVTYRTDGATIITVMIEGNNQGVSEARTAVPDGEAKEIC